MIHSVEGIFRDGKIELFERPSGVDGARVIVTFLPVETESRTGPLLTLEEAAELRGKLAAWEEDWNAPGMEAYDDYEARRRSARELSAQ